VESDPPLPKIAWSMTIAGVALNYQDAESYVHLWHFPASGSIGKAREPIRTRLNRLYSNRWGPGAGASGLMAGFEWYNRPIIMGNGQLVKNAVFYTW